MGDKLSVALLVTTYNWPEALKLVLESVLRQSILPDEIIIADDGSGIATRNVIETFKKSTTIPVKHFWHPDEGFRKTIIINQAITGTASDYVVQIDGDIVLHKHFIRDHASEAEPGYYIRGSRVMLSEDKTQYCLNTGEFPNVNAFAREVKNRFNALRIPFLAPLLIKKSKRSRNLIGCNCAFWKEDFLKVNGYNNELKGWGHEDIELAARFINSGLSQKRIKMKAVCYHLHHPFNDRVHENVNYRVYLDTLKQGITYCTNGYCEVFRQRYDQQQQGKQLAHVSSELG